MSQKPQDPSGISPKALVVVAPGCPAAKIEELLTSPVLPPGLPVEVLLPPEKAAHYEPLWYEDAFRSRVRWFPSPARRFFSVRHLMWLREQLASCPDPKLLIYESPFKDPFTALISVLIFYLAGKTITLLFATPEAVIDLDGQGFSDKWIIQDLNQEILVRELHRVFWFLTPWDILYFLMAAGLIVRQLLVEKFSFLSRQFTTLDNSLKNLSRNLKNRKVSVP